MGGELGYALSSEQRVLHMFQLLLIKAIENNRLLHSFFDWWKIFRQKIAFHSVAYLIAKIHLCFNEVLHTGPAHVDLQWICIPIIATTSHRDGYKEKNSCCR